MAAKVRPSFPQKLLEFESGSVPKSPAKVESALLVAYVRSLEGRRGGTQKQSTHQKTKEKLSSATPNRDTSIHCQRKRRKKTSQQSRSGISTSPTPCCESLQQHPKNSKQHGTLAKMGNMQAGPEIFNHQPYSPGFFFCLLMGCLFLGSPPSPLQTPNVCNKKGTFYLGRGLGNRSGLKF